MSIPPIDIQIKDNRRFTLVAFFVDRDDFLKDIVAVRKRLKITALPYAFPNLPYVEANNVVNYYHKGVASIYDVSECFKDICAKEHIWFTDLSRTLATAVMFSESLVRKYHKNRLYLPVVLSSLLTGVVRDADFSSTRIVTIDKKDAQRILDEFENDETMIAIQVNRESKPDEVKDAFVSIQNYYFGEKKANADLRGLVSDNAPHNKLPDTISNIMRDRKWYWQHKDGLSYQKIWSLSPKNDRPSDRSGVIKQIYQYRDRLKGVES